VFNFIIAYCIISLLISLFFFREIAWSVGGILLDQESILVKDILYLIFFPASYATCLILLITFCCIEIITGKISTPKILSKIIVKRE